MLAASAEVGFEEPELYELCRDALRCWPQYASELESDSGIDLGYSSTGTLVVADDRDASEALRRAFRFQQDQGYPVEWLSGSEAIEREPMLSPRIVAAVSIPEDHAVDNRKVLAALKTAIPALGGTILEHSEVIDIDLSHDDVRIRLESGEVMSSHKVVLAAGAWSGLIPGLAPELKPPVRPVKGQILELRTIEPFELKHVIRGPKAYLVPRSDGRLIVGATSEEMGFDARMTVGGVYAVMDGAWEIVPGILDQELVSIDVGFRPGSRDHQPIVGHSSDPRLFVATGHYRHGIVLSAVTAMASERMLVDGQDDERLAFFTPHRF